MATKHKEFGRKTFEDYAMSKRKVLELQAAHNVTTGRNTAEVVANRAKPLLSEFAKEGGRHDGATVTKTLGVVIDFISEDIGYFFVAMAAVGVDGHAIGVIHNFGGRIILFDPNYGEISWGHEGPEYARIYAKSSLAMCLYGLTRDIYDNEYTTFLAHKMVMTNVFSKAGYGVS